MLLTQLMHTVTVTITEPAPFGFQLHGFESTGIFVYSVSTIAVDAAAAAAAAAAAVDAAAAETDAHTAESAEASDVFKAAAHMTASNSTTPGSSSAAAVASTASPSGSPAVAVPEERMANTVPEERGVKIKIGMRVLSINDMLMEQKDIIAVNNQLEAASLGGAAVKFEFRFDPVGCVLRVLRVHQHSMFFLYNYVIRRIAESDSQNMSIDEHCQNFTKKRDLDPARNASCFLCLSAH